MPFGKARDSTRSSAMSGPLSGNSRVPWPTTTGQTSRFISSTRPFSSSHRVRAPLPCTCSSPASLAFSSPMAAARSPDRTVVSDHFGSVSAVDATYLGRAFKASALVPLVDERHGLAVEQRPGPSAARESGPAVLIRRAAVSLHHSIDGDLRRGRQFHGFVLISRGGLFR